LSGFRTKFQLALSIPLLGAACLFLPPLFYGPSSNADCSGLTCAQAASQSSVPAPKSSSPLAKSHSASISIDYPEDGSIFPPEITPPTFIWRDQDSSAKSWRIEIAFADGSSSIRFHSLGEPMKIGEIDKRCISSTNQLPSLTPEQAAAHTWKPEAQTWDFVKRHPVERSAASSERQVQWRGACATKRVLSRCLSGDATPSAGRTAAIQEARGGTSG
jgi:hypothetical protein